MQILLREIRCFYRNIPNVLFTCTFPLIMVFLLGNMLENIEKTEHNIGEVNTGYIVNTEAAYISGWKDFVNEIPQDGQIFFREYTDEARAKQELEDGTICAVIYLQDENIEVRGGNDVTKDRAVKSMIDGFLMRTDTINAVIAENPVLMENVIGTKQNDNLVVQKECTASRSMIDYYAITILVMMIFMGGLNNTCNSIYDDRKNTTLSRIYVSPKNKAIVFWEVIFGNIPYVFIQIFIVMIGSSVLLHAKYCDNWRGNFILFLMLFSATMALSAFSALIGIMFKKWSPFALIMGISWVMLFLSGSFAKNIYIEGFSEYLPTTILQNAAFDMTVFGHYGTGWRVIVFTVILFLILLGIGTALFNKGGNQV